MPIEFELILGGKYVNKKLFVFFNASILFYLIKINLSFVIYINKNTTSQ